MLEGGASRLASSPAFPPKRLPPRQEKGARLAEYGYAGLTGYAGSGNTILLTLFIDARFGASDGVRNTDASDSQDMPYLAGPS